MNQSVDEKNAEPQIKRMTPIPQMNTIICEILIICLNLRFRPMTFKNRMKEVSNDSDDHSGPG
ncbi:MAG: hypothetical protein DRI57_14440 [Deltaproteobacteria bacterium]|nr:MAG: hypothetical protein DRI57_14440 [Deltaproteobacteria bacterium]